MNHRGGPLLLCIYRARATGCVGALQSLVLPCRLGLREIRSNSLGCIVYLPRTVVRTILVHKGTNAFGNTGCPVLYLIWAARVALAISPRTRPTTPPSTWCARHARVPRHRPDPRRPHIRPKIDQNLDQKSSKIWTKTRPNSDRKSPINRNLGSGAVAFSIGGNCPPHVPQNQDT